jgi:GT2 family glycosyltransferase
MIMQSDSSFIAKANGAPGGRAAGKSWRLAAVRGHVHVTPSPRPPVSVVILAWNAWAHTAACLDSVRRSIGPLDQVVVVDNGSSDDTAEGLAARPWVDVVTNPHNRGFAGGCNDGARAANNEFLVFLNNDTVVPQNWLTTLLEPFSQPLVGATGPRSNAVSGIQLLTPVPYASPFLPEFERFANAWAAWFAGQSTEVNRLVGFCLAIRREAFEDVEGFDERYVVGNFEDDDICRKLTSLGWTLRLAQACFVHHDSHVSFIENNVDFSATFYANQERFMAKWHQPA